MIFVSYYSGENYKICSNRLKKSLRKFGLPYYVIEVQNTGDKQHNISKKPQFVKDCLIKFRQPVCWIDADSEIMQYPKLLLQDENVVNLQIYNWLADQDNHVTRSNPKMISQTKILASSGTFAFNYSEKSLQLLDEWIVEMKRTPGTPDDQVLDKVFNNGNWINKLKCRWLPKNYNRMVRFNDWTNIVPVINNTETSDCPIS